jgi:hypothetical protein
MTLFMFPTAVAIFVFGSSVVLASFAPCTPQNTDLKLDCWTSTLLVLIFACIGSVLTGLMALLARVVLHPFLPFDTRRPELISAMLSSAVLVLLFYSVLPWEFEFGNISIQSFGWLGASFVVCGVSLLLMKHWMM